MSSDELMFKYLDSVFKDGTNLTLKSASSELRSQFDIPPCRAQELVVHWIARNMALEQKEYRALHGSG